MNHTYSKQMKVFASVILSVLLSTGAQAQNLWTPANGPYGGTVWDLLVTPKGQLFAATHLGGIFISDDVGKTWKPASSGRSHFGVCALAMN